MHNLSALYFACKDQQMERQEDHQHGGAGNEKSQEQSPNLSSRKKSLVIFASGTGTNAEQIIKHFKNTQIAEVVLIACNKPGAGVISIAADHKIPVLMLDKERFFKQDAYLTEFNALKTDFIILAGFLWKLPAKLIDAFPNRIINIHPALLPKYGGKGMYGQYVHEAVLNAGDVQTGITIHFVNEHYDEGATIFQTACPVLDGDTPEKLAGRIHQLEHMYYPVVIEELCRSAL